MTRAMRSVVAKDRLEGGCGGGEKGGGARHDEGRKGDSGRGLRGVERGRKDKRSDTESGFFLYFSFFFLFCCIIFFCCVLYALARSADTWTFFFWKPQQHSRSRSRRRTRLACYCTFFFFHFFLTAAEQSRVAVDPIVRASLFNFFFFGSLNTV